MNTAKIAIFTFAAIALASCKSANKSSEKAVYDRNFTTSNGLTVGTLSDNQGLVTAVSCDKQSDFLSLRNTVSGKQDSTILNAVVGIPTCRLLMISSAKKSPSFFSSAEIQDFKTYCEKLGQYDSYELEAMDDVFSAKDIGVPSSLKAQLGEKVVAGCFGKYNQR